MKMEVLLCVCQVFNLHRTEVERRIWKLECCEDTVKYGKIICW
jgi:hypothetical protein